MIRHHSRTAPAKCPRIVTRSTKFEPTDNCEENPVMKGVMKVEENNGYVCWEHTHGFTDFCGITWPSKTEMKCKPLGF